MLHCAQQANLTLSASQTSLSLQKERDVSATPKQGEVARSFRTPFSVIPSGSEESTMDASLTLSMTGRCYSEHREESRVWMLRLVRQAVEVSAFNLSKRLNEL